MIHSYVFYLYFRFRIDPIIKKLYEIETALSEEKKKKIETVIESANSDNVKVDDTSGSQNILESRNEIETLYSSPNRPRENSRSSIIAREIRAFLCKHCRRPKVLGSVLLIVSAGSLGLISKLAFSVSSQNSTSQSIARVSPTDISQKDKMIVKFSSAGLQPTFSSHLKSFKTQSLSTKPLKKELPSTKTNGETKRYRISISSSEKSLRNSVTSHVNYLKSSRTRNDRLVVTDKVRKRFGKNFVLVLLLSFLILSVLILGIFNIFRRKRRPKTRSLSRDTNESSRLGRHRIKYDLSASLY